MEVALDNMMLFLFYAFIAGELLFEGTRGQELDAFMADHKGAIEEYIMSGYGGGWKQCDVLTGHAPDANIPNDVPHLVMDSRELQKLNIGSVLSSAHCLVASYHVNDNQSLSALFEFGWRAIQYKRIAVVLRLGNGVTLHPAINRASSVPFLVVALKDNGEKTFICPVVGEVTPWRKEYMCPKSYSSFTNKALRIGMVGPAPYFVGKSVLIFTACPYECVYHVEFQLQKMASTAQMSGR